MKDLLYFTEYGSGPPLLLIHGLMVTGEMFEPVIGPLAGKYRLIIPDLRGHGQSRELGPPYTIKQLAEDLSELHNHLNIDSSNVIGYSQGGALAQQFAIDYPNRCRKLVLACTYAYNMATFREKIEGHIAPVLIRLLGMKRLARLVVSQGGKLMGKDRADWLTNLMASQDRKLMLSAWRESMAFDSRQRLRDIQCPTLIIAGSEDNAVPFHHAKMLNEGIRSSRLSVVKGADHTLIWTHPGELVRLTHEFLRN